MDSQRLNIMESVDRRSWVRPSHAAAGTSDILCCAVPRPSWRCVDHHLASSGKSPVKHGSTAIQSAIITSRAHPWSETTAHGSSRVGGGRAVGMKPWRFNWQREQRRAEPSRHTGCRETIATVRGDAAGEAQDERASPRVASSGPSLGAAAGRRPRWAVALVLTTCETVSGSAEQQHGRNRTRLQQIVDVCRTRGRCSGGESRTALRWVPRAVPALNGARADTDTRSGV